MFVYVPNNLNSPSNAILMSVCAVGTSGNFTALHEHNRNINQQCYLKYIRTKLTVHTLFKKTHENRLPKSTAIHIKPP